ncbi:MAG: GMC family oxidoreductase [Rhodospirillaceae bacterium]|nr:GMC family oxidoreductase [Rhodospirillales bacterium]
MATRMKPVDAVIVGLGWTGSIFAKELTDAGLSVVALERGRPRDTDPDFQPGRIHDELAFAVRHQIMQDPSRETLTFRNSMREVALPMRQLGSFLPGEGVGGAGVHWNGQHWRFLPSDFKIRSHVTQRYGRNVVAEDMTIQDWPVSYDELEPHYDRFEQVCGTTGKAGNLKGQIIPGGNPFEGPRSREYPNPPMKPTQSMVLFAKAAAETGYHPFPQPASNASQAFTNAYGIAMGACVYCGFCERFGCEVMAKASPQASVLPALDQSKFELRTQSQVLKVNLDSTRRRATGVTYMDAMGREIEQPADIVVLAAYGLNNVHLMLLSGIGEPYDPSSGRGVVGKNYAYQIVSSANLFFQNQSFNPFMGAGALGSVIDDANGDNFDHSGLGFISGGYIIAGHTGARPIQYHPVPEGTPKWGTGWKRAVKQWYGRSMAIATHGAVMSHRANYLDLDPTYKDAWGRPLLRMTFDYRDNDIKMSNHLTSVAEKIGKAMNPTHMMLKLAGTPYSIVPYQTTHNTGGAIMGDDPSNSAVNRFLQAWDVSNVFVPGASAFPQNAGYNPTGTVGALAYWALEAIKRDYLKNPGPLEGAVAGRP